MRGLFPRLLGGEGGLAVADMWVVCFLAPNTTSQCLFRGGRREYLVCMEVHVQVGDHGRPLRRTASDGPAGGYRGLGPGSDATDVTAFFPGFFFWMTRRCPWMAGL